MATKQEQEKQAGTDLLKVAKKAPASGGAAPRRQNPKLSAIIEELNKVQFDSLTQPDHNEVFNDQSISTVVDAILGIIKLYEKEGIKARIGHLDNDITRLHALLASLSMHCSHASVESYYAEENLKYLGASIYEKTNAVASDKNVYLTKDDYTSIARLATREERERRVSAHAWDKMLTNVYHTARQFALTLTQLSARYPIS